MARKLLALVVSLGVGFAFTSAPAFSQDEPEEGPAKKMPKKDKPKDDGQDDEELTPGSAVEQMNEIARLMRKAEELLNGASLGKAATEQEEILKLLKDLTKQTPDEIQKQVVKALEKLLKKSEERQKDVIDKLTELIKKAKSGQGS